MKRSEARPPRVTTTRAEVLRLLGLARRAGAVVTGTGAVRDAVRSNAARFVLLAEDAAPGQTGKIEGLLRHRTLPRASWGTQEELGRAVGTAPLSAMAITEEGFAGQLRERLAPAEGSRVEPHSDQGK